MNVRARVALCGLISTYNDDAAAVSAGPRNFGNLLIQRVHLEGFIVLDHLDRAPQVVAQLAEWMAQRKLTATETVVEGFEQLPPPSTCSSTARTPASSSSSSDPRRRLVPAGLTAHTADRVADATSPHDDSSS